MVREVERIEQDLVALEEAIALLKVDFHSTYEQYLKLLGQAVRQQLILASYQVCTQGYPDAFLALSFNQRQKLQQAVRKLGRQVQEELLSHLEPSKPLPDNLAQRLDEGVRDDEILLETEQELADDEELISEEVDTSSDEYEDLEHSLSQPGKLLQWQERVEKAIAYTLQTLSLNTNRLLQKHSIIPDKLPPAVLEAAVQVEASTESTLGSPNLLNLLMEAENEQGEKEESTLMRVIAINLRLSEIEFADTTLSAGRSAIRKLSAKVSSFQREYDKKQRERAVAQAESAWRSSWFDD